jgi:putative protease
MERARYAEILAPAGDEECLKAAVGAGADAVYFGLSSGFNARAKAANFTPEGLPDVFGWLHERGVKGYVAFNTVVYDSELAAAERLLASIARAGADAIIVQDLGIARFAHALAPTLPIHASTQMTVSSPEAAEVARELGVVRVILPRELSIEEIRRFHARCGLELECFVHGALCVSWSGQCLTSEAWGQRSANRGQCAQSCRLPYDLVLDGRVESLGVEKYLLSPKDLGAFDLLPDLVDAGISCFKIEGRYKGPEYVAATVEKYRKVRDAYAVRGERLTLAKEDVDELTLTYSRSFSPGWLSGDDHQELSHGVYPGHRGIRIGPVERVSGFRVHVRPEPGAPPVKAGDWMVFDQGDPEGEEPKGGVFAVEPEKGGLVEVRFGDPGPDLSLVKPGDVLWKSHDSALKRRLLRYVEADRKLDLDVVVRGAVGRPLEVAARDALGRAASVVSEAPLERAKNAPLGEAVLREKLGALGETRWRLGALDVALEGEVAVSPSELKRVRRRLVEALEKQAPARRTHEVKSVRPSDVGSDREQGTGNSEPRTATSENRERRAASEGDREQEAESKQPHSLFPVPCSLFPVSPVLIPLCRTLDQVDAALAHGAREVDLDFMELTGLGAAVRRCRSAGARVVIATPRVQKPGEEPIDRRFESLEPDGILARHLGALHHYRSRAGSGRAFTLHGDFSLNCTNAITGRILLSLGLATLTPSYDLNIEQVEALARGLPAERLEVTAHQHLPLYHTEYCLYAHHLSEGRDYRDCGRPCEAHRVSLRDAKRLEHPVLVDVGCRNTVFNARAQSAAAHVARLQAKGVRRFRVEFVWETREEAARVLASYAALLAGRKSAAEVVREVGGLERYGVTSGTLTVVA